MHDCLEAVGGACIATFRNDSMSMPIRFLNIIGVSFQDLQWDVKVAGVWSREIYVDIICTFMHAATGGTIQPSMLCLAHEVSPA